MSMISRFLYMQHAMVIASLVLLSGCGGKKSHQHLKRPGPLDGTQISAIKAAMKQAGIGTAANEVPVDQLPAAQEYYMQLGWIELERKVILRRIKLSKDHQEIAELMTKHGELELAEGEFEKAKQVFALFKQLYPGDPHIKRVLYGELIAHVELLREPDRDQSLTKAAIALARHYVEEFPDDELFLDHVIKLLIFCYERLLASELMQIRFYVRRFEIDRAVGALVSAERRLKQLPELVLKDLALFADRFRPLVDELATLQGPALQVPDQDSIQGTEQGPGPAADPGVTQEFTQRAERVTKLLAQLEQQLYFTKPDVAKGVDGSRAQQMKRRF